MHSAWKIEYQPKAIKDLNQLDKPMKLRIIKWLEERIYSGGNPRLWGKQLKGDEYREIWRYRIGNYRVMCTIQDKVVTVTVVAVGHRKEIYT